MARYDLSRVTIADLRTDPDVVAIAERYYPGIAASRDARESAGLTGEEALRHAVRYLGADAVARLRADLDALPAR